MKVLIVDDEKPARDRLRQILADEDGYDVVGEAANGHEALEQAASTAPDIVLLDIRMPGMEGIETAHHLNAMDPAPAVVFTTAYDEYAIDAFEARAIGYVLKPVRRSRLTGALELEPRHDVSAHLDVSFQPPGDRSVRWRDFFGANLERIERICADRMRELDYAAARI